MNLKDLEVFLCFSNLTNLHEKTSPSVHLAYKRNFKVIFVVGQVKESHASALLKGYRS